VALSSVLTLLISPLAPAGAQAVSAPAAVPAEAQAVSATAPAEAQVAVPAAAAAPRLGWTSWSQQSSSYPGLNPRGDFSYLTEATVLKQAGAMAATLKDYGYTDIDIDAGWWMSWDWTPGYDGNARQAADPRRFPDGMKYVADRIHRLGLQAGIYLPVGLEIPAYGGGTVAIAGAPGCTTADVVFPDLRTTNGWSSSYKLDFSRPCAAEYVASQAALLKSWGFDRLKLDGVGPGSGTSDSNVDDVAAWKQTGLPIDLSWSLDPGHIADWQANATSWLIDTDVECFCHTLVTWDNSVDDRWADVPAWTPFAHPGGWNNLDALDVGNGAMDGLTEAERQSAMTLWAISASPLTIGDDLTRLDAYGRSLLTNREVLAVDQQGLPARPVSPTGDREVWGMRNADGSYTVALFNLGSKPAPVSAYWSSFGFGGPAQVRDLWSRRDLGARDGGIEAVLPAHGSRLLRVTPPAAPPALTTYEAEAPGNTLVSPASRAGCDACSGGVKVGNLYGGGALTVNDVTVPAAGTYQVNVGYVSGDPRSASVSANGGPATAVAFPPTGGWGILATITVPLKLAAGANTITLDSGSGYSPDIDSISVPQKETGR
jgi:hypothetical protein